MADPSPNEGATKLQLAVLCIVVLASDITVTIIFPFGGFMVGDLVHPANPDDTGYYFGWLASAFMLGRAVSVFPLSWASDRFGRKPFIYLGLIATFFLNIFFGLSPNYGFAVAMRVLCGFLNAVIAIGRTMVGEMCPEGQQARALAYVNGMWSLGLVLGSGIGGLLAQPADKYEWAANNAFANKYPYFLPMLLPAVLCAIAFVLTIFCLPETRGRRFTSPTSSKAYHTMGGLQEMETREGEDDEAGEHQAVGSGSDDDEEHGGGTARRLSGEAKPAKTAKSIREQVEAATGVKARTEPAPARDENARKDPETGEALGIVNPVHVVFRSGRLRDALKQRKVHLAIASEVCVGLVATGFDEILPLWAGSRVESGGLGLTSSTLGEVLASGGVIMAVWQLFAAPRIQDKIDMYHSFRLCCTFTCACMVGTPFFHYVTKMAGVGRFGMLAALVVVLTLRNIFVTWCLTVSSILVNNSVPASQRGAVNGLTGMLSGFARSIGPPFGTMLFAFSLHKTLPYPLDFHFAFTFWGALFFVIGLFSASFPAELRHPAKDPNAEAEEREDAREQEAAQQHQHQQQRGVALEDDEE